MDLLIIIAIIALGYFFGRRAEKKHYDSILLRETQYKDIVVLNDSDVKKMNVPVHKGVLLSEGVAIALDAFKNFIAKIVGLLGGRIRSYETLVDRARREAILRLKEQAVLQGCNALVNLRLETSSIGAANTKKPAAAVECIAYATALSLDLGK